MTSFNLFPPLASITLPVTPEALPNFHGLMQLMLDLILFLPFASISTQVTPEALSNFHRHIQLMTKLGHWREQSGVWRMPLSPPEVLANFRIQMQLMTCPFPSTSTALWITLAAMPNSHRHIQRVPILDPW
jgi:hypothetical protein